MLQCARECEERDGRGAVLRTFPCGAPAQGTCIYCRLPYCGDCFYTECSLCFTPIACMPCGFPLRVSEDFAHDCCQACAAGWKGPDRHLWAFHPVSDGVDPAEAAREVIDGGGAAQ